MKDENYRPPEVGDETATEDFAAAPPPSLFRLRAQLVDAGSQSWPLAETENLWLKIRTYAAGEGENAMHAHYNQDHSFIVLQGEARFFGPRGEVRDLGRNEGIMLPEGCWYCFENSGADPLVVLRIAAVMPEKGDPDERHGIHGEQIDSHTAANKRPQETVFRDGEFYE